MLASKGRSHGKGKASSVALYESLIHGNAKSSSRSSPSLVQLCPITRSYSLLAFYHMSMP